MSDSITSILSTLSSAESADTAYLVAGAINLYSEALRRKQGRILYGPADVEALLGICTALLSVKEASPYIPARAMKPTPEEEARIMEGPAESAILGEVKEEITSVEITNVGPFGQPPPVRVGRRAH